VPDTHTVTDVYTVLTAGLFEVEITAGPESTTTGWTFDPLAVLTPELADDPPPPHPTTHSIPIRAAIKLKRTAVVPLLDVVDRKIGRQQGRHVGVSMERAHAPVRMNHEVRTLHAQMPTPHARSARMSVVFVEIPSQHLPEIR
jgi:hypothetical protein